MRKRKAKRNILVTLTRMNATEPLQFGPVAWVLEYTVFSLRNNVGKVNLFHPEAPARHSVCGLQGFQCSARHHQEGGRLAGWEDIQDSETQLEYPNLVHYVVFLK